LGKDKLKRFAENLKFTTLIQPEIVYPPQDDRLKGKWKEIYFKNQNALVLELGCGRGEYTISLAEKFPDKNFIGIDWKGARLWRGAKTAFENGMNNAAFLRIQIQNISSFFSANEVDEIWITFPDPQPDKEKKRLTSPRYLNMYRKFMTANGIINLKTDSRFFYDYTLEITEREDLPVLFSSDDIYYTHSQDEILSIHTTYEKRWLSEGSKICFIKFRING